MSQQSGDEGGGGEEERVGQKATTPIFATQVNLESESKHQESKTTEHKRVPYKHSPKIEEVTFCLNESGSNTLPESVDIGQLMGSITSTKKLNRLPGWKKHFESTESMEVIQDTFWWFFCNQIKEDSTAEEQAVLFDRIAQNFVMLFLNVPRRRKDNFFKHYNEAMAHVIHRSFCEAYPRSRSTFEKKNFKERILSLCAHWTLGMRPTNTKYVANAWTTRSVGKFGRRGTMVALERETGGEAPRVGNFMHTTMDTKKVPQKRDSTPIQRTDKYQCVSYTLTHGPLVKHFLELRKDSQSTFSSPFAYRIRLTDNANRPIICSPGQLPWKSTQVRHEGTPHHKKRSRKNRSKAGDLMGTGTGTGSGGAGAANNNSGSGGGVAGSGGGTKTSGGGGGGGGGGGDSSGGGIGSGETGKSSSNGVEILGGTGVRRTSRGGKDIPRTYADVIERAERTRQKIKKKISTERSSMEDSIRRIRRKARERQNALDSERDTILRGDVREWSNLLTARAALEEEGGKGGRPKY